MNITKTLDGKFTTYQFAAGGHNWTVLHSTGAGGFWTVLREPRGAQINNFGKTFWRAADMIAHYRTAAVQLALIAREAA